jgi:tetrahydromethanopterin S-methyltransferase subunit H
LIEGVVTSNKIFGLEYAKEVGLINRIIYNSLIPLYEKEEIEKIQEVGLKSVILLAMNTNDLTAKGRIVAIDNLLSVASVAAIEHPLIDTCVLDVATLGQACWALFELKKKYGFPVGCGAHNAVSNIGKRLKTKYGKRVVEPCTTSVNVMATAIGADFLLYGPIETADYLFPAIGMVDTAYGQLILDNGQKLERTHPRFKILRG